MKKEDNYIAINKKAWDNKTPYLIQSPFYDMESFLQGKNTLTPIELELLGDVTGKRVLHLQCHFGQDTISLGRMGATVTGVDFSEAAIQQAVELAHKTRVSSRFICCDIYDIPNHLDEQFDIVFTSYGTIGWLPDLNKWAGVISKFLRPGGKFVFAEFHPVVWMFDPLVEKVQYNYFKSDAIIEIDMGTYADKTAPIETETVSWNHSLSEVINSLILNDLQILSFNEYDYSPYNCFMNMDEYENGKYRFNSHGNKLPLVYSITAIKI